MSATAPIRLCRFRLRPAPAEPRAGLVEEAGVVDLTAAGAGSRATLLDAAGPDKSFTLHAGDHVAITISGIGTLANDVIVV